MTLCLGRSEIAGEKISQGAEEILVLDLILASDIRGDKNYGRHLCFTSLQGFCSQTGFWTEFCLWMR